jgi:hypothetical protein
MLTDCGSLSVGVGLGLGANIRVGHLTQPSIGVITRTWRIGFEDRDTKGLWDEFEVLWPTLLWFPDGGIHGSEEACFSRLLSTSFAKSTGEKAYVDRLDVWFGRPLSKREEPACHSAGELQIGVTFFLVSVRMGINPPEITDLLLGFFGVDIAGDYPKRHLGDE